MSIKVNYSEEIWFKKKVLKGDFKRHFQATEA